MKKSQVWIIDSIRTRRSRLQDREGQLYEEVTMTNLDTREQVKTYLDPLNRNYCHWNAVLANRDQAQLIKNVSTAIRRGRTVINADSEPTVLWSGSREELDQALFEDQQPEPDTQFDRLFN
jgi:hypothetical protein